MADATNATEAANQTASESDAEFFKRTLGKATLTKIEVAPTPPVLDLTKNPEQKQEETKDADTDKKGDDSAKDDGVVDKSSDKDSAKQESAEDSKSQSDDPNKGDDDNKSDDGNGESKPEEKPIETEPPQEHRKKTAKERVQEKVREAKHWKNEYSAAQQRILDMERELQALKTKKPEELSPKELAKEGYIEAVLEDHSKQMEAELNEYIESIPDYLDREKFKADYSGYITQINEKDPWTIELLSKIPEKYNVLDAIFSAVRKKQFTMDQWINESRSVKIEAVQNVLAALNGEAPKTKGETKIEKAKETVKSEKPIESTKSDPKEKLKSIPNSVIPENTKTNADDGDIDDESFFRAALPKNRNSFAY